MGGAPTSAEAAPVVAAPPPAFAAQPTAISGSSFDPSYIISDERFFDNAAMSQAQIQAFLDKMVPTCRATNSNRPCLKNLVTSTNTRAAQAPGHCTGYNSEGWESAARIIWRVAQACRISPQVILATLQKEQGLVTATAPTDWQYKAAMGYGCPDTAPCDARYYNFFNQVYMGAWQFRQYTYNPSPWRHRIGPTAVFWHPNSGCGTSIVNIRNQATANLYNYTPYRPNAAALQNLYGLGDGCSSYGNRNFWRTFTEWFGSPTLSGIPEIDRVYNAMGGATGNLGAATSDYLTISGNGAGTARAYTSGSIYWTARTGAHAVYGAYRDRYFAYQGATGWLSWPTSSVIPLAGRANSGGQAFAGGSIYYSPATGSHSVRGAIRAQYFALNGADGWLGLPDSEPVSAAGGQLQQFTGGAIAWTSTGGARPITAAINAAYAASGGPAGILGWPTSTTYSYSVNGGGSAQTFAGGTIYASAAGAFAVRGGLRAAYFANGGGTGTLGWPTSDMTCASSSACQQDFQGGTLFWTPTGSRIGDTAIEAAYAANGGAASLGARMSGVVKVPQNGGGYAQAFQNASIYASTAGAFVVKGGVRQAYFSLNGSAGTLGWPTAAMTCVGSVCEQSFQGGTLYWTPTGWRVGLPVIEAVHTSLGGDTGALGKRTSVLIRIPQNGGGYGQTYETGSVYSSAAGAFAVVGGIRATYFTVDGSAGLLGWPTSAQSCDANGACSQSFQGGTIDWSSATGGRIR
ncbi:hypothetical protein ACFC3F_03470 [Microbacterium sp. NPDC055910]|uniref:hypothetical protein n=1 Tax=Microbacterium sp. NPDC055910 TaxID=3345659 RepID=UPI0035DD8083